MWQVADLEQEASSPQTRPTRLQELANDYPRLRPLIAMNPATYPALVQWLGTLDDPSVNVALAQRDALNQSGGGGPRRVSVMGREYTQSASALPVGAGGSGTAGHPLPPTGNSTGNLATSGVRTPEEAPSGRGPSVPLAALILGLVAIIVLAFVGYRLLTPSTSPSSTETAESAADHSDEGGDVKSGATTDEAEGSSDATDATPETPLFPAPSSALSLSVFVSPSGNIACSLGEESVTCTINSYSFVSEDMQTCGAGPLSITADAEKAGVDCAAGAVQSTGATTLAYEDFAANGNTACRSTEDGVACWNIMTGVGFGISRSGYQIGLSGPVDPAEFPWA